MTSYTSRLGIKPNPRLGRLSLRNLLAYSPNLMLWGGASAFGLFVFVEGWPTFQDAIFKKIPIVGSHWNDNTPPEDKPV
ncbi:hypothetical protein NCAS_0A04890 [Naumovozyma castellii]|uniref:Uncharacterized protein n=1 Tax=Naumovozyma castellii TaxID=27288 RepID=G0V6F5_NAUCA|nr:hypothetical protein NCAS_0A04890 [Naumovozyma castellii CBS 4309]CCC67047.1 hypothetical protein NCAS_0A04890 [Naumovozyma castellii CBS 4309]